MIMKFETEFLVFDVSKGPKIIVENLNTYGQNGWELKSMINVAGEKLVAFLQRQTDIEEPKDKTQEKLKSLWSANGEKDE